MQEKTDLDSVLVQDQCFQRLQPSEALSIGDLVLGQVEPRASVTMLFLCSLWVSSKGKSKLIGPFFNDM